MLADRTMRLSRRWSARAASWNQPISFALIAEGAFFVFRGAS
jgi:hypothetical protein